MGDDDEPPPTTTPSSVPPRMRNLRSNSRRITLRNRNLTSLPDEEYAEAEDCQCTVLEMSHNKLTVFPINVLDLTSLVHLDLSNNRLEKLPAAISQLKELHTLNLNSNSFDNFPLELNEMGSLEHLLISHNHIETIPTTLHIPHLRVIYASHNDITSVPETVKSMSHLQEIHMKNNLLGEFAFVEGLPNLLLLDVSHNMINSLPNLSRHFHLTELNLSHNRLNVIPFVRGVTMFDVSHNFIDSLQLVDGRRVTGKFDIDDSELRASREQEEPAPENELPANSVHINESRLSVMGNSLMIFNISGNRVRDLSSLYLVHSLQQLVANDNQIEELPESICKLHKLTHLNLAQNRVKKLPKKMHKLKNLQMLQVQDNLLDSLPASLVQCAKVWPENGGCIGLAGNPLASIPAYYRPINMLHQFLQDLAQDSQQAFIRSRVMVVGDCGVGKTTLVRKLTGTFRTVADGLFNSIESTVGFDCTEIQLEKAIRGKDRRISLCFWDFGGESQYQDAHAFFSSSSAQYILAFDILRPSARSLTNWLNLIQITAPGAVVYLVATHFKKASAKDIKVAEDTVRQVLMEWKPAFSPPIQITRQRSLPFWAVSNTFSRTFGTTELGDRLADYAASKVKRIPRSYLHLMTQVITKKREGVKILSWNHYSQLALPFEFSPRKLKRATKFLHEWGFVFHFPEEVYGQRKWVIINPEWLMKLFTSVIGFRKQKEHHGPLVKEKQLQKIWKDEAFDDRQFDMLIGILENFRMMILWKYEESIQQQQLREYLVPSLLTREKELTSSQESVGPAWPADFAEQMMSTSKIVHFRIYGVPYAVPGLFTGLIVKMRKRVQGEMRCWKNTMVILSNEFEARLSLESCLKSLNITQGIHVYAKATDQESCNRIIATIHWELSALLAFSYQSKLLENVLENTWVFYQGLWIKREEILVVFNESEEDQWEFSGVTGTLQSLLPEMYCLPDDAASTFTTEITDLVYLRNDPNGTVYKGTWTETGEIVSVLKVGINHTSKWVSRAQTSFIVDGFYSEVMFLNQLQHRNIARFLTYYNSPPVLVEEHFENGTLGSLFTDPEKRSRMSWPLLIRIAQDLALAVQYLHNQTPPLTHGNLTLDSIVLVDLNVNADQVIKLTNISLKGDDPLWRDTAAYVALVQEMVDDFIVSVEQGESKSLAHYAEYLLEQKSEGEELNFALDGEELSQKHLLRGALGAELLYETVSDAKFLRDYSEDDPDDLLLPHLRDHITGTERVVIPKIFQRIIQISGRKKLPDFDHICSMFTTYLDPEKTSQLLSLKVDSISAQSGELRDSTETIIDDSPPTTQRKKSPIQRVDSPLLDD